MLCPPPSPLTQPRPSAHPQVEWDAATGQFVLPHKAFTKVFQVRTELQLLDPSERCVLCVVCVCVCVCVCVAWWGWWRRGLREGWA